MRTFTSSPHPKGLGEARRVFAYTCRHIPSGMWFNRKVDCLSRREFYDKVIRWNANRPDLWAYACSGDD